MRAVFPKEYADCVFSAFVLAGNIPHCLIDPAEGIKATAISAGTWSAGFILDDYPDLYGNQSFANTFKTIGLNTSFWSFYQGYVTAREMAAPGTYPSCIRRYSFKDLFSRAIRFVDPVAPFRVDSPGGMRGGPARHVLYGRRLPG